MNTFNSHIKVYVLLLTLIVISGCATKPITHLAPVSTFNMQTERYGHSAVADDNFIYIIGGSNKAGTLSSIEILNPNTNTSKVLHDIITPRRYHTAVWDGNESIYIFGGFNLKGNNPTPVKSVEIFNTRTQKVTSISMPYPRIFNSGVVIGNQVYLVGGELPIRNKQKRTIKYKHVKLISRYDLDKNRWFRAEDLPTAKSTKVVNHLNQICALGGYDGKESQQEFHCLNPLNGEWTELPTPPVGISAHSVVTYNNRLISFGNYNHLEHVFIYNFDSQKWVEANTSYTPSRHNASVVFDNKIYVIGGLQGSNGPFLKDIQVFSIIK
jgi:N-acetylneuraminic acid mutarotase